MSGPQEISSNCPSPRDPHGSGREDPSKFARTRFKQVLKQIDPRDARTMLENATVTRVLLASDPTRCQNSIRLTPQTALHMLGNHSIEVSFDERTGCMVFRHPLSLASEPKVLRWTERVQLRSGRINEVGADSLPRRAIPADYLIYRTGPLQPSSASKRHKQVLQRCVIGPLWIQSEGDITAEHRELMSETKATLAKLTARLDLHEAQRGLSVSPPAQLRDLILLMSDRHGIFDPAVENVIRLEINETVLPRFRKLGLPAGFILPSVHDWDLLTICDFHPVEQVLLKKVDELIDPQTALTAWAMISVHLRERLTVEAVDFEAMKRLFEVVAPWLEQTIKLFERQANLTKSERSDVRIMAGKLFAAFSLFGDLGCFAEMGVESCYLPKREELRDKSNIFEYKYAVGDERPRLIAIVGDFMAMTNQFLNLTVRLQRLLGVPFPETLHEGHFFNAASQGLYEMQGLGAWWYLNRDRPDLQLPFSELMALPKNHEFYGFRTKFDSEVHARSLTHNTNIEGYYAGLRPRLEQLRRQLPPDSPQG